MFAYAMTNRDLGDRAWATLRERWDETQERFPSQLTIRLADGARYLTTPEQVTEVQAFFAEHPIPQSAKMLEQMLERQRVAAALRERATPDLEAYFSALRLFERPAMAVRPASYFRSSSMPRTSHHPERRSRREPRNLRGGIAVQR